MSVVIKVLFGEKLYRLAPGTQTLEKVDSEMKQRFPSIRQFRYFYQESEIKELSLIIGQLSRVGSTSLKITAKAEKSDAVELNTSSLSEIKMSEPSQLEASSLVEKSLFEPTEPKFKLPSEFYLCYNCLGKGEIKQASVINLCGICKGAGKLQETHRYVLRMKELFQLHFCPAIKAESVLSELKTEIKPEVRSEVKPAVAQKKSAIFWTAEDKTCQMLVKAKISKSTLKIGELFSVRFEFSNIGKDWSGRTIQMIEDKEHKVGKIEGRRLSALKSGENMAVQIGPFVCKDEAAVEKSYHLYFRDGDSYIRFGHKFGFSAKAEKKVEVKKNEDISKEREKIRDLKMLSGSKKSEEYLLMKLKSLGINLLKIEMHDEDLIDLIKQIN